MLAGMWGANLQQHSINATRSDIVNAATRLLQYNATAVHRSLDQELLRMIIWPVAQNSIV